MDPNDIQNTNFCNSKVNNIISNDMKSNILKQIKLKYSLKFNDNYAKIFNEKYKQNLQNKHIACLKSCGNPYLFYLTKINNINYCLLIDKKINEGYSYPKIFILPYEFDNILYDGTLIECELVRSKLNTWSIIFIDLYSLNGNLLKNKSIINRIKDIYDILESKYKETEFCNICNIVIKHYINLNDLNKSIKFIVENTPYKYRGIYYIPINTRYVKMLDLFNKNQLNDILNIKTNKLNFLVDKTHNVEIYEIYLRNNDNYKRIDYLYIPNIEKSKLLKSLFDNKTTENLIVTCKLNETFNKWEFIEKTNQIANHIKDLN
jgi:hypothetical protein